MILIVLLPSRRQYIMSDLERWRQLFREEAQRCVQELREVLHGANDEQNEHSNLGLGASELL